MACVNCFVSEVQNNIRKLVFCRGVSYSSRLTSLWKHWFFSIILLKHQLTLMRLVHAMRSNGPLPQVSICLLQWAIIIILFWSLRGSSRAEFRLQLCTWHREKMLCCCGVTRPWRGVQYIIEPLYRLYFVVSPPLFARYEPDRGILQYLWVVAFCLPSWMLLMPG
jgi:hypothetical protein